MCQGALLRCVLFVSGRTGESDYDKPRILEIAEVMQNIDSLDEGKKKQDKAIKKGKEAELQARKLQVSLNEVRCEEQYIDVAHHAIRTCPRSLPVIRFWFPFRSTRSVVSDVFWKGCSRS